MEFPDPTLEEAEESTHWRNRIPSFGLAWRGLALGGASLVALRAASSLVRRNVLYLPLALPLVVVSLLCAWGSAIHLAGGQRYDDQTWH